MKAQKKWENIIHFPTNEKEQRSKIQLNKQKNETKKLYTNTFTFTRCKLICPIRSGNIIMDFMFLKNNGRLFVGKGKWSS